MKQLKFSLFLLMCSGCSSYHTQITEDIEKANKTYNESKKQTEEALLKKNKDAVRIIHIDLDQLNRDIDEEKVEYFEDNIQ